MRKILAASAIFTALGAPAFAGNFAFTCLGSNPGLSFALYEDANGMYGGHMYLAGTQIATLQPWRVNAISIRATVAGNSPDVQLVFNSDRRAVYIELGNDSELLCNADVR